MPDEAEPAPARQIVDDYERRVAKDIVTMLLDAHVVAQRVLALGDAMLNVKPPGEEPPAASAQPPT
jgi:uncharacterized heparinase superfamily protein